MQLTWGAAWRAQSLHIAFFVLPPVLLVIGKGLIALVFPLLVITGPGDSAVHIGRGAEHLRGPGCWLALAPCAYADMSVPGVPSISESSGASEPEDPFVAEQGPLVSWPHTLTWRHLWFLVWLTWFVVFIVDRDRQTKLAKAT